METITEHSRLVSENLHPCLQWEACVLLLWEVCPKRSAVHEGLMVLGMAPWLLLGRRPMEEAGYLASLLAQVEDIICVTMWKLK